jgi:hypothetical protein
VPGWNILRSFALSLKSDELSGVVISLAWMGGKGPDPEADKPHSQSASWTDANVTDPASDALKTDCQPEGRKRRIGNAHHAKANDKS